MRKKGPTSILTTCINTPRLSLVPFSEDLFAAWIYPAEKTESAQNISRAKLQFRTMVKTRRSEMRRSRAWRCVVIERQSRQIVGTTGIIFHRNKKLAEGSVEIFLWPRFKGQGYGREAIWACLKVGFTLFSQEVILGKIQASNRPARRLFESLGFSLSSRDRNAYEIDGKKYDMATYCLTRQNWKPIGKRDPESFRTPKAA